MSDNRVILMKKILLVLLFSGVTLFASAFKDIKPAPFVNTSATPAVSASLAFPVAGKKAKVGSFWGAVRDGGKRKHEGIDIFAKKGTPVVAVCDGIIISSGNTPRGGKTIWLQSVHH